MRGRRLKDKTHLLFRQGFFASGDLVAAQAALVARVFDDEDNPADGSLRWWSVAAFEASGRCVASVEARVLTMLFDGRPVELTGLRRVGVDPDWRGHGLVRDLLDPALRWCEAQTSHPTLLYAEVPDLYTRFGFAPLAQHAFVGAAPVPPDGPRAPIQTTTVLDPRRPDDADLIRRHLDRRAPLSAQCALVGAEDLVFGNIRAMEDIVVAHISALDAIILYEMDEAEFTLVDVVASTIPSLSAILGALALAPQEVKTLFPPDRLAWSGTPQLDDTGLMSRGSRPEAMTRPFRLPPTGEF